MTGGKKGGEQKAVLIPLT